MNIIYYSEVNLICIIILALLKNRLRRSLDKNSTNHRIFNFLLCTTILLCASDMIAGIFRGQDWWGARIVLQASNLVFYESLTIISYLWMIYAFVELKIITHFDKKVILWAIPMLLFSIMAVLNPFTGVLFIINKDNLYVRNAGIYLHWLITWFYVGVTTVQIMRKLISEKNKQKRKGMIPLLCFAIAPTISGMIQMFFYGVTSTQVGVTISLVIIFLEEQSSQILTDSLSGLNNRHSFNRYLENFVQHYAGTKLSFLMIDLNKFKQINDKFGHLMGDRALEDAAQVLKQIAEKAPCHLFLCRYGGDEFLIATYACEADKLAILKSEIQKELEKVNQTARNPYFLKASIGIASGECWNVEDAESLLRAADQEMYNEKYSYSA